MNITFPNFRKAPYTNRGRKTYTYLRGRSETHLSEKISSNENAALDLNNIFYLAGSTAEVVSGKG